MCLDGQGVGSSDELGRGDEDQLTIGARGGGRHGGRRVGSCGDGTIVHALAYNLGAVDVDHGAVVSRHGDVHAADGGGVSDREGGARVGGQRAGLGRAGLESGAQVGGAVADGGGAAAPGGIVVRGLGPVLRDRVVGPVVRPGGVVINEDSRVIRLGRLAVGVDRVRVSRGTSQAVRGDGAHEKAVVAAQGHGDGG